jgi:hypothetical protein
MAAKPLTILYIAGFGHSGSTLLDLLAGSLPGAVSCGELNTFWPRAWRGDKRCGCGATLRECPFWSQVIEGLAAPRETSEAISARRREQRLVRMRNTPALLLPALFRGRARRELARTVALRGSLYGEIARVSGATVVVDSSKSIGYGLLLRRLPGVEVRFLHLVRDAHGPAYSYLRRRPPEQTLEPGTPRPVPPARTAARWMLSQVRAALLLRAAGPYLRIRYEDLCRDPASVIARVAAFAGTTAEGFSPGAVVPSHVHTSGGNHMRFATSPLTVRFDEAWRRDLPAGARRAVTAITLPLLVVYGYISPRRARNGR